MNVPFVTRTDLGPLVGVTRPWMSMTGGSLRRVATAPGLTIGNALPSQSGGTIMTGMDTDAALLLALGWKTTLPRVVPTMTPTMSAHPHHLAIMMTRTPPLALMDGLVVRLGANTCLTTAADTGSRL